MNIINTIQDAFLGTIATVVMFLANNLHRVALVIVVLVTAHSCDDPFEEQHQYDEALREQHAALPPQTPEQQDETLEQTRQFIDTLMIARQAQERDDTLREQFAEDCTHRLMITEGIDAASECARLATELYPQEGPSEEMQEVLEDVGYPDYNDPNQ